MQCDRDPKIHKMSSPKKEKGASAPEAKECANCLAPEGQHGGVTLKACTRCKATHYCGRACQTAHWRAGHKRFCVTPEERAPQPTSSGAPVVFEEELAVECAICLDPLASGTVCTLPCAHTFHAACVAGLRSFGVKQVCPMCREDLPPGPDQLFEDAACKYLEVNRQVGAGGASWGTLNKAQQREMDEVNRMWRSAAEQGHLKAQFHLGFMYHNGQGVKQDKVEAVRWYRKAAVQGCSTISVQIVALFYSFFLLHYRSLFRELFYYTPASPKQDPEVFARAGRSLVA
jgi:TPR repeat protein